jgi:hypothetical protein
MVVTAPVCPRKTDIGKPSGKRHYENQIVKYQLQKIPDRREKNAKKKSDFVT